MRSYDELRAGTTAASFEGDLHTDNADGHLRRAAISLLAAADAYDQHGVDDGATLARRVVMVLRGLRRHALGPDPVPADPHCPHCCAVLEETHGREEGGTDADA